MTSVDEKTLKEWRNLAPDLVRQRLIIEGTTLEIVSPDGIKDYLNRLAEVTAMEIIAGPHAYSAHELGYGGWVHWRTSGCHFYSYPGKENRKPLFTVDTYTCKPFSVEDVVEFTKKYFSALDLVWKEIEV